MLAILWVTALYFSAIILIRTSEYTTGEHESQSIQLIEKGHIPFFEPGDSHFFHTVIEWGQPLFHTMIAGVKK
jgi:hypothetical protein